MRVFVLCTGRCGSTSFAIACKHIKNFTSGHESLVRNLGDSRFDYKDYHIEVDNRLSWFLGKLDNMYGNNAFYVHLKRNRKDTAKSFSQRYGRKHSIIDAYSSVIKSLNTQTLSSDQKSQLCYDYIETVEFNIECFLKDKMESKKMIINIENINVDFRIFWEKIGALGNLDKALNEFDAKYNSTMAVSRKLFK